jgi:large subunit ribosomal protein L4
MSAVTVIGPSGVTDSTAELPDEIFDAKVNVPLIHQVVVAQLAAARQGTHAAKTRGQVRGGGKKPYRQKGTGRARQGSLRAPQYAGGGTVHGPVPRTYAQRTPKKMKAAALRGALSDRARAGLVHVVSSVVTGDTPSTKSARTALEAVVGEAGRRVLAVVGREDEVAWLSLRNLPTVHVIAPDQLNTYDVLVNDAVVFTQEALDAFLAGPIAVPTKSSVAKAIARESETIEGASSENPFGPQSHAPLSDGSQPEGFPVKGNTDSMLYHVPGSSFYARTEAEVWFASAEAAEAAGFQLPPSQRKEADK